MAKTSSLKRVQSDNYLIIRASHVAICGGDVTAAALISYFDYWHTHKLQQRDIAIISNDTAQRHGEGRVQDESLLQFHTLNDLSKALMGLAGRHAIEKARDQLEAAGIISKHRNPNPRYKFDNTIFYQFHPEIVNAKIDMLFPGGSSAEISTRTAETGEPPADKDQTINNNTLKDTIKEDIPAHPRGGAFVVSNDGTITPPQKPTAPSPPKKTAAKKPEKPAKAARPHWQALVDTWHNWYKGKNGGEEPNFRGRNPAFFGQLVDLLHGRASTRAKRANRELQWTEKYACEALVYYLELAWGDGWLKGHFLLSNLVDQFDAVYAREALRLQAEKEKKTPPAPTAQTGVEGELQYLRARFKEGDLDPRMITPDIYDKLTGRGYLPVGTIKNFPAPTFEESKVLAVKDWLERSIKSIANETE